jgi:RHS repeat-associated protein
MTSDGSHTHTYKYDAEGNILTVDNGGTATYIYDAMNRRVSVQAGSATHEYAFDYAGRRVSSWLLNQAGYPQGLGDEGRIYWDGQQIAYRALDGSTYFDHQDYLGTERVRTNSAGASVATFATLPWGDGGTTTFGGNGAVQDNSDFAGLDFDQASGTDHAQFRNYSPAQGRWLAPDPYDGSYDATNPQSFSRYAYVLNNPLSFKDPSGLEVVCSTTNFYVDGEYDSSSTECFDTDDGGGGHGGDGGGGGGGGGDGGGAGAGSASSKTQSLPQNVCQALVVNTALTQMNTAVQNANQKIYGGFLNNPISFLAKTAIGYAAGGNLPGATRAIVAVGLSEAWTILQQVPPGASSVYDAAKQAEQNLQSCGGG